MSTKRSDGSLSRLLSDIIGRAKLQGGHLVIAMTPQGWLIGFGKMSEMVDEEMARGPTLIDAIGKAIERSLEH